MSKIVVFKSYACKLEYFKSVEIVYPDKQNDPILVEITLTDGSKNCIFASQNVMSCWLFLESMKIIEPKQQLSKEIIDYYDALFGIDIPEKAELKEEIFFCCGQKLKFQKNVAVGKKWRCDNCRVTYDIEDLISRHKAEQVKMVSGMENIKKDLQNKMESK